MTTVEQILKEAAQGSTATWEIPEGEQRLVWHEPAFHRCDPNPSKDYGIGSVSEHWVYRSPAGAVTWEVMTNWPMPAEDFFAANPTCTHPAHQEGMPLHSPMGGRVMIHSRGPLYEEHVRLDDQCAWIDGAPCYPDVGFLLGGELFDLLCTQGSEAVWVRMRELLET